MNVSLRKSLTGIALSCALLCSTTTVSAHESGSKKVAKTVGHLFLAGCGAAGVVLACLICLDARNKDLKNIIKGDWKNPDNYLVLNTASLILVPGAYTTYKNIRELIKLYTKKHHEEKQ